ncbi:phospho-N-acetylmuramoyl-pentapeptide-transferase [Arthrobacter sp. HMSC06H05]|uniref:Phospho-N-acetylmuramoyl-pentapeptide-transferase n=2 Tax=Pseudoglutamicibacter albus TaxID=98671 RepID=A0A095YGS0_9MICC|nr:MULTISPECIES: phospho-N-acetylmuramoyl-pentapeptide-transferase [Micrococcaceae]KGF21296.1 phospho-N-acetylmuramoyl-pentapeptide-transferase [Pseudoglutamicibacter albus DNF00011]KGF21522.1 phospho-N-acetylmuramoyl-pentapeptide-transferase [Pseudoglutamicibacter albus DNF00011]MCG7304684.1 phospho-N-acetylmuramoyl-pentapeptide-transferase [Pseudoglutamicibacter albus]MDR7293841.1 phospho-N-acetylmuramoyl-pentapeptide-transferase [Pseudoglutamicibacter albus]OFT43248.1 phospho-N-acetylmuramo
MLGLVLGGVIALIISFAGTPLFIRLLTRRGYGQFVREDGPQSHMSKRGTPTMGGAVFVTAAILAYFLTHLILALLGSPTAGPTASGLLLLLLMAGMGMVGFFDDYAKIRQERSLGLTPWQKILGQGIVGVSFAVLALMFPDEQGRTPGSMMISAARDIPWLDLSFAGPIFGGVLFVIWANLIATATTNGVNLTDGLDGLATGISIFVFSAYALIGLWQETQSCGTHRAMAGGCYEVRDPMDLAIWAVILIGALVGFLWWNTKPARIFMGDTGSLALGGAVAAFAILGRTQLLLIVIAGMFVLISLSVIIQVGYFKLSGGKRVFLMAPLQHHFELKGWQEVTVVVRFWILGGLFVIAGLCLFYLDWLVRV